MNRKPTGAVYLHYWQPVAVLQSVRPSQEPESEHCDGSTMLSI